MNYSPHDFCSCQITFSKANLKSEYTRSHTLDLLNTMFVIRKAGVDGMNKAIIPLIGNDPTSS